ncbi:hypothetical protein AAH994_15535 [Weeksellaceae bacterium A-14]
MITRKKFLYLGSLSLLWSLIPSYAFSREIKALSENDTLSLLKKARSYRKHKKLNLATRTYKQVLDIDPTEIRAYNGIRKILLNKKNKEYEVIQLYQKALVYFPDNIRIKRRLYNEYFKVAIGNKKVLQEINFPGRLLLHVRNKYEEMLADYPEKKNLQKQLEKIEKYIELNVDTENPHNNIALKAYRKEQKKNHKRRFDGLSAQKTTSMLAELEAKPVSMDRVQHIREMSKVNVQALRAEKRYSEALDASEVFLNTKSIKDPLFVKQFRDLAKYLHQYDRLLSFEKKNHAAKNSFWSACSLFDAYLKKAARDNSDVDKQTLSLLQFLEDNCAAPDQIFELNTRRIKLLIGINDLQNAFNKILSQCNDMTGISNSHLIDRMNVIIGEYCKKQGEITILQSIVDIALNPKPYLRDENELVKSIALLNSGRSYDKSVHIQNLQQKINSL